MAGVGKSSIGAEVSRYFDLSFIDTDRQIESLKKTKLLTLISYCEDQFQVLEADTVVNNIKVIPSFHPEEALLSRRHHSTMSRSNHINISA